VELFNRRVFFKKSAVAAGGFSGVISALGMSGSLSEERRQATQQTEEMLAARLARISSRHPSLHFNDREKEKLLRRVRRTHSRYAGILCEWVDRYQQWSPSNLLDKLKGNEVALEQCGAFITNAALAFVVSRRGKYLQLVQKWASEMCDYPQNEVRNYGFGIYAAGLARAYDWLYHDLTPGERERIRATLVNLVSQLYQRSLPGARGEYWWAQAYIHHDHWVPVGGYGEAALALLGEVKEASRWAAHAKVDFDFALSWLGEDGAWHEGAADWCYTVAPLLWFYGAWQGILGENLHDVPWIRNTAAYRLYHWLPDDSYVYLNDSFRSGRYNTSGSASCHLLRRLASLFRDSYAQWLAERDEAFDLKPVPKGVYQAPYESLSYTGNPVEYPHTDSQCVAWNLLWYDPEIRPVPPDGLPRARHFRNQGVAILRTGWDKDAAVISLSCAPLAGQRAAERVRNGEQLRLSNYSHAHADYSSFTLFARGQYFIVPPGYARRGSGFQNVVSVNGTEFVIDPSINVSISGLSEAQGFSCTVADATEAFPREAGVEQYRRYLVLLDCGWMILLDDLKLTERRKSTRHYNRFAWAVHSDPAVHKLSVSGTSAVWKAKSNNKPGLYLHVLEPRDFAWECALLQSTSGKNMREVLRLIKPEWYSGRMSVLSAWSWLDRPETPALLRHSDFLAVLWSKSPGFPSIGFTLAPGLPSDLSHPDLQNRRLILFGHDPQRPDSFILVEDGRVK